MTFDEGLPPFWSDPRQLDEARQLLLSAAELVWPPPSREGFSGGGTGGSDSNFRTFLCGHAAGRAVMTGIEYHLKRVSGPGSGGAVRHEPESFVTPVLDAGKQALDTWQQLQGLSSSSGSGDGGPSSGQQRAPGVPELLARCGRSPAKAMEEAVWDWQQEQQASQGGAAPLLQLVTARVERGGGSSGVAPMVLVRLDVAGLLDLASSIRLAEELAMDLLM